MFANSVLATGVIKLLNDVMTWLMILAPIAGGLCLAWQFIKKSQADEQEQMGISKKIKIIIISTVGAEIAAALITLVTGYF